MLPSLMLLASLSGAHAADWFTIAATEEGRPDEPVKLFGFVQPQVEWIPGGAVEGLEAEALQPFEGTRPRFNLAYGRSPFTFALHRARLGARGSIPKTDQRVSYYLLAEAGEVSITRASPVVVTDMSVTVSYVPGARVRVGQFKLPVMEEIVQGVASSLEFVHFSNTLQKLMLENPIEGGAYTGGSYGFRDVGVQVFDGGQWGSVAASYAVMASNGAGMHVVDTDEGKDLSARGEVAWVTDGERHQGRREEVKVGGWWLQGPRTIDDLDVQRVRRGAFLHVEQGWGWALVEVAQGEGALETGFAPPFSGGAVTVAPEGVGWGLVAQGGVRFPLGEQGPQLGLKARFDQYHQQIETPEALRRFRTVSAGVELNPAPAFRVLATWEMRSLAAPEGSADAQAIAASMADRLDLQLTARF